MYAGEETVVNYDLTITGGKVATGTGVRPLTIAIRAGRIAGLLDADENPPASEQIDASGLHILPGVIDTHVHLRDPGTVEREDFITGTSAAAAGGVTTILEMPSSDPPATTGAILARRAEVVQPRAIVDYALYGAAGHESIEQIPKQAAAGAIAFKTFLTEPAAGQHGYAGLWCSAEALYDVMMAVADTGLRHCFHCENNPMLVAREQRLRAAGRVDGLAHAESRPPMVENSSVAVVLALAAEVGGPVQTVHTTNSLAVQMATEARARGVDVTVETCPQYLFLTEEALQAHGSFARCNPPLRSPEVVEALWRSVEDGQIDVLGTDHAPHLPVATVDGREDIFEAPAGLPGLEVMLPLMLTAVHQKRLHLPQLVRLLSERAAEVFRLPRKGRIAPGYDADLVLVDLPSAWTFDYHDCFTKARESMRVYQGWPMTGRIISTFVRGVRVYHDGEITGQPGHGKFLRPDGITEFE